MPPPTRREFNDDDIAEVVKSLRNTLDWVHEGMEREETDNPMTDKDFAKKLPSLIRFYFKLKEAPNALEHQQRRLESARETIGQLRRENDRLTGR